PTFQKTSVPCQLAWHGPKFRELVVAAGVSPPLQLLCEHFGDRLFGGGHSFGNFVGEFASSLGQVRLTAAASANDRGDPADPLRRTQPAILQSFADTSYQQDLVFT